MYQKIYNFALLKYKATSKAYALSNGTFYYTTSDDKKLKPYRIFLTVPESIYSLKAPIYSRINRDEPTDIEGVIINDMSENGQAYNLMGIPVDDSYKGLVIVNGKKVICK